jgi:hypothetical protein
MALQPWQQGVGEAALVGRQSGRFQACHLSHHACGHLCLTMRRRMLCMCARACCCFVVIVCSFCSCCGCSCSPYQLFYTHMSTILVAVLHINHSRARNRDKLTAAGRPEPWRHEYA